MTHYGRILLTPEILEQLLHLPDGVHILSASFQQGLVQLTVEGQDIPGVALPGYWPDVSLPVVRPRYTTDNGHPVFQGWEK